MELRSYQSESLAALFAYWAEGGDGALIELATGTGKSLVMAELARRLVTTYADFRIAIVAHVQELIAQNHDELRNLWLAAPSGIYSAGLNRRERAQITFCGIQSIYNKAELLGHVDLLLVDECFVAGTLISTPSGPIKIEEITPGDEVFNALGLGICEAVRYSESSIILEVVLSNGNRIECTENHPFFTDEGYKEAGKLEVGRRVFSEEDLRSLRNCFLPVDQERSRGEISIPHEAWTMEEAKVLFDLLLEDSGERDERSGCCSQDASDADLHRTPTVSSRWQWEGDDQIPGVHVGYPWRWVDSGARGSDKGEAGEWLSDLLQAGPSEPIAYDRDRAGWGVAQRKEEARGRQKRSSSEINRVESVSRSERRGETATYNLQVSGHPSYYAGGVLVHNCHLIPRKSATMYGKFIAALRAINPDMRIVGLTATPYRLSTGRLDKGDDRLFDSTVYTYGIADGVRDGYLARLTSKGMETRFDLTGVQKKGGEYVESQLQAAVDKDDITRRAVAEAISYGQDGRKSWLAFCSGVEHAYHVRDEIRRHGVVAETITGKTPSAERAAIIADFKAGRIRCLTNNSVLTTGFNAPGVDMIMSLRPTASPGLYVQMAGRGTRTAPGKDNCLVLDYARLVETHGPVDDIRPPKSKGGGIAPIKECPTCHTLIPAASRECPECGHVFEPLGVPHEPKITAKASNLSIMKGQPDDPPTWLTVMGRTFALHHAPDKPPSVLTKFKCGIIAHKRWYAPARSSKGHFYADRFWFEHGGDAPAPNTAEEWLERQYELRATAEISVKPDGKYFKVEATKAADALVLAL